jgi:hypothetical protein
MAKKYIEAEDFMRRMYKRAFETDGDTMWQSGCWVRYRAIEAVVKETPAADVEPRWIPCSERLPEEICDSYWVCTDSGYQCECRWTNINPFWTNLTTDWHWNIFDIPQYTSVIAWMPLPEPYKGGAEE